MQSQGVYLASVVPAGDVGDAKSLAESIVKDGFHGIVVTFAPGSFGSTHFVSNGGLELPLLHEQWKARFVLGHVAVAFDVFEGVGDHDGIYATVAGEGSKAIRQAGDFGGGEGGREEEHAA